LGPCVASRAAKKLLPAPGLACYPPIMPSGVSGMRGIYDRHEFSREKREAFETLAAQIEHILNPADNVVPLRSGKTL
jgi:hypothetical protein